MLKTTCLSLVICFGFSFSLNAEEINLLSAKSRWKKQYIFIPQKVSAKAAKAAGKATDPAARAKLLTKGAIGDGRRSTKVLTGLNSIQLPEKWKTVGFNDSDWHNAAGTNLSSGIRRTKGLEPFYVRGTDPFMVEIGLIAQRGKFIVKDPSKVKKLTLEITYRGGFIAFLNGKKVGSGSLPKGEIAYDTPADDYPLDAFVIKDAKGKMVPLNGNKHKSKKLRPLWAKRERKSGSIKLDPKTLVKGVNILALELHRSDFPVECTKKKIGLCFSPVGLGELSLKADTPAGNVVSACVKPDAFRVWKINTWETLTDKSFGNPAEELEVLNIVGAKNGTFAGELVVSSPKSIEGLTVKTSSLKSSKSEIKADKITFMYGASNLFHKKTNHFDLLLKAPPAKAGNVLPIWISVDVPADVQAGVFKGKIEVSIKGAGAVSVPVELTVSNWSVPDVKDYTTLSVIYQSPESLVRHYKVAIWSEKHWELIEKSFKLMGEFGNSGLIIPLLAESCMGNPESMVIWLKQNDGSYKYDFKIFDRYLETAMKYHSPKRIKLVSINVWGYENRVGKKRPVSLGSKITVKDGQGKNTNIKLPEYGTPECEAMWKPLLLEIHQRLKKYKLEQKMMFGLGGDPVPSPKQAAMFNRILPGTPWFRESHFPLVTVRTDAEDKSKTVPVGMTSMVWGEGVPDPAAKRLYGWKYNPKNIKLNFKRNLKSTGSQWDFRQWMEGTIAGGRNGNSRVGGDYYNFGIRVKDIWSKETLAKASYDQKRAPGCLFNTYPDSNVAQTSLGQSTSDLFGAGKDGPVTTMRFENARLGNQEAEARIVIEKAILAKKLPPALAKKCQAFLDNRTTAFRLWFTKGRTLGYAGWRASNKKLFDLAGEVAAQ